MIQLNHSRYWIDRCHLAHMLQGAGSLLWEEKSCLLSPQVFLSILWSSRTFAASVSPVWNVQWSLLTVLHELVCWISVFLWQESQGTGKHEILERPWKSWAVLKILSAQKIWSTPQNKNQTKIGTFGNLRLFLNVGWHSESIIQIIARLCGPVRGKKLKLGWYCYKNMAEFLPNWIGTAQMGRVKLRWRKVTWVSGKPPMYYLITRSQKKNNCTQGWAVLDVFTIYQKWWKSSSTNSSWYGSPR